MIANGIFLSISQVDFVSVPYRSVVSKLGYGCLAATDTRLVAYIHLFGQTNNVPVDACSNIICIHILPVSLELR